MSDRYQGGIITKTPVTPTGPSALGTASGIWTLEQQAYWQAQGLWPDANNLPAGDAYYKYVTMLLPGNGTNGAQNNTFLDSSSNAFTITRNGNTTQGTFSPYGSNWGNYFNGSTDYFDVPSSASISSGFTMECWAYPTYNNGNYQIAFTSKQGGGSYDDYLSIHISTTGYWRFNLGNAANYTSSSAVAFNTWTHLAVSNNGSTTYLFVNGTLIYSTAITPTSTALSFRVGAWSDSSMNPLYYYYGYVSNARVTNTCLYTSSFTPSTTPLTAVSGTQVLTCQSNRFIDNSSNAYTLTVNGSPSVQRFSPFELPYPGYTAATYGGSGYFDGSGDYLSVAANSAFSLNGDFTIEGWIYPTGLTNELTAFCIGDQNSGGLLLYVQVSTQKWRLYSGGELILSSTTVKNNAWYHVAVVRSGSTITLYVNGTSVGTTSNSSTFDGSSGNGVAMGGTYGSGSYSASSASFYLGGFRVVKGTAVYTTTFTPPTAPLTAISNTSFLANYTNTGIIDNAMMNDLETAGNAQISTTQSKFGGSSMYFDGTGDYLVCNNQNSLNSFGRGDFTVEFWLYVSSAPATNQFYPLLDSITSDYAELAWTITLDWNLKVRFQQSGSSLFIPTTAISTGTWTHIAIVRSGNTTKEYLNGDLAVGGSGTDTMNYACGASRPVIGTQWDNSRYLNGYLQDVRITKGYARYTGSFTPPTQAFYTY